MSTAIVYVVGLFCCMGAGFILLELLSRIGYILYAMAWLPAYLIGKRRTR